MSATENVNVLFTDLVGSTELSSSLTPEAADGLRRRHFAALRQAIVASGGTEVKNLGDGLMAVFPVASAALNCAVAMQQAVHRDNIGAERALGLRVGVSAGEATREADDYFGDPVVEAARLCARAEGGQILVADVVRATAGRRSAHRFISVGELQLKGLPEPVETLEVGWEPLTELAEASGAVLPLPARLVHRPRVGLVGRDLELSSLIAMMKRVSAGEGREVVLVAGEPGQGKTTLVSELARRAHGEGMTVLLGRCDEEVGAPYRPFHEALAHLVVHADEGLLRAHVAAHGGELSRLVPSLDQRLGGVAPPHSSDADTERYLLYAAVVGLLDQVCGQTPVLLFLDDLHWVDRPSLQLLRHVVANTSTARLLIVCTFRDAELSASHPLTETLAALHREPSGVSSVDLKGLADTGVLAFMEAAAGHVLDDAAIGLAHQVYRETDGNPFFVSELLRNLAESGAIYQDENGRWSAAGDERQLALPSSIRTVIGSRLSRLGEDATRLLSTASVIGRDFDLDVLVAAAGVDEDELIDLLDQAHHAALVDEIPGAPGRYSFSHALVQQTLYEDLGPTRRTRLHRSVGEAIEALYGENSTERVGELARHFFLATRPTEPDKAIAYARRAGQAALEALAPEEAVRYFTQALDLASQVAMADPALRTDLLLGLGTAQRQAGIAESRATLLEAAREARRQDDSARLAAAALENNRGWFTSLGQVDTEKVEVLEAALSVIGEADSPERALLLGTLCSELHYGAPLERRRGLADEAKAIARRLGDRATFVEIVGRTSVSLIAPSTLAGELADTAEAVAAARELGDPAKLLRVSEISSIAALRAGDFEQVAADLATAEALAEQLRQPLFLWELKYREAAMALVHGDPQAAERHATVALDVGTAGGQPDAVSFYGVQLMTARIQQGRLGELVALIADAADKNPTMPLFNAVLAYACMCSGDQASAVAVLEELAANSFAFPEDSGWFAGVINCARVAIELQLVDHCGRLYEMLAPYHDQVPFNGLGPQDPVATYLGGLATVLGRYDDAEQHFREASRLNERGQMLYAAASTDLLWGQMLRRQNQPGDIERARALLEGARNSAASRGYARIERQAADELAALI